MAEPHGEPRRPADAALERAQLRIGGGLPLAARRGMLRPPAVVFAIGVGTVLAIASPSRTASAGIEACGDIHVEAQARCELLVEGGCEVQCEPVRMEAACAARLYAECRGQCEASVSAECRGGCEADCQAQCLVDPGEFDCRAECQGRCDADCEGRCSSDDSACFASCRASCSGECDSECDVELPQADCEGRCEASCEGSCRAQANADCQIDCQADGFVDCELELSGGCRGRCQEPEGALFCDGQYVDHGGNLEECIDALQAALEIEVEGRADAQCDNGRCEAEAEGSIGCQVGATDQTVAWRVLMLCGVVVLLTFADRRGGPRQA